MQSREETTGAERIPRPVNWTTSPDFVEIYVFLLKLIGAAVLACLTLAPPALVFARIAGAIR
jgi:hypothetical protein